MKIRVLFVDDEPRLLEALQRSLRPLRNEWETRFAGSGQEALAILDEAPFDVIVTDMRMPAMDGVALLKTVTERHGDLLRIVLSGQSDVEAVVKASGVAHQYVSKPCPIESLKDAVVHAFAVNEKLKNPQLRCLISGIDALPSLPDSYHHLTRVMESPNASLTEIGQIICRDIAMSSKILQLVNSAFFGRSRQVSDPGEAVSYLGTGTIKALVIAVHSFRCFGTKVPGFDVESLWTHSIACGALSEVIAQDAYPDNKDLHQQARTAGLLHDIGRLVIASRLASQFTAITKSASAECIGLCEAECRILGVSHAEIGAYLLAFWGLPSRIVEAVAYHHCPSDCLSAEFSALTPVHLANGLLRLSDADASYSAPIDEGYLKRIGFATQFAAGREAWLELLKAPA